MDANREPRVVLVHDWLTGMRGGEKCLEVLCRRWPRAKLLTLLHRRGSVSPAIERLRPKTSFLNRLPGVHHYYRWLLPLMPKAVAGWAPPPCDLVVSFSHCAAKAVRPPRGAIHVCYCFTPMRYAWHMRDSYFGRGLKARLLGTVLERLRQWDRRTAAGVTHFLAISKTVQRRIEECYNRDSTVIYPPVDTDFYCPAVEPAPREDFYLVVSAFAPYKRIDLAVTACKRLGRPLVVIGTGQDAARLRRLAGPNVHFLGWKSDAAIRDLMRRCRALLFPGEEDFGIVPVEAMACGAPVIAYGRGGAVETVIAPGGRHAPTGLFFMEQTADCLADALTAFEMRPDEFSPAAARRQALRFNKQRYEEELCAFLMGTLQTAQAPSRRAA
jgi:glycosyltransferase involved in cell wall biosynthesis